MTSSDTPGTDTITTTAPSVPARRGRPPVHIDVERIRELAALGMTAQQIADRCHIGRRTLFSAMERDPEIKQAMDEGLAVAVETATRTLWDMAINERNLGALIFWMKCRGGMTIPKQEVQVSVVPSGFVPMIDGHVLEMAARQSALLDNDDTDDVPGAGAADPDLSALTE